MTDTERCIVVPPEPARTPEGGPGVNDYLLAMSHELRAPLNTVIGMSGLLLDGDLSSAQRQYVRSIHAAGEGLGTIINDVLDLCRVASSRVVIEPIPFDLKSMIEETAKVLTPRANERGLALRVDWRPELARHVIGDPGRTRQVLGNLVGHAVNATSQGEVVIRVMGEAERNGMRSVRFVVEDTGIGIAPERLDRIFEEYIPVDASPYRSFGVTGLGLRLSADLVRLMGGDIGAESRETHGSRFWFSLPMPAAAPPVVAFDDSEATRSGRVMIVEADESSRNRFAGQIAAAGWDADFNDDIERLIDELREADAAGDPYQACVFSHYAVRPLHLALATRLKAESRFSGIALVMITGVGSPGDGKKLWHAGFAAYLRKPVAPDEMQETLAALGAVGKDGRGPSLITRHSLAEARNAQSFEVEGIDAMLASLTAPDTADARPGADPVRPEPDPFGDPNLEGPPKADSQNAWLDSSPVSDADAPLPATSNAAAAPAAMPEQEAEPVADVTVPLFAAGIERHPAAELAAPAVDEADLDREADFDAESDFGPESVFDEDYAPADPAMQLENSLADDAPTIDIAVNIVAPGTEADPSSEPPVDAEVSSIAGLEQVDWSDTPTVPSLDGLMVEHVSDDDVDIEPVGLSSTAMDFALDVDSVDSVDVGPDPEPDPAFASSAEELGVELELGIADPDPAPSTAPAAPSRPAEPIEDLELAGVSPSSIEPVFEPAIEPAFEPSPEMTLETTAEMAIEMEMELDTMDLMSETITATPSMPSAALLQGVESLDLVSPDMADQLSHGGSFFVQHTIAAFLRATPALIAELVTSGARADATRMGPALGRLAAAAASVGGQRLEAIAHRLAAAVLDGNAAGAAAALGSVEQAFLDTREALGAASPNGLPAEAPALGAQFAEQLSPEREGPGRMLALKLLDSFASEAPGRFADMRTAIAGEDAETSQRLAQTLKGMCGLIGAEPLAKLCALVEADARLRRVGQAERYVAPIEVELARVQQALTTARG